MLQLEVQTHVKTRRQLQHKGWARPYVEVNTLVYLLKFVGREGYFTFGYLTEKAAVETRDRLQQRYSHPANLFYIWNKQSDPEFVVIKEQ